MRRGKRSGFTLFEALASVVLLSVGIFAATATLGRLSEGDHRVMQKETMQKLAIQKMDELIATGQITNQSLTGDFMDSGNPEYSWEAKDDPSGVDNLDTVSVTVRRQDDPDGPSAMVGTLMYKPPAANSSGSGSTGGGR